MRKMILTRWNWRNLARKMTMNRMSYSVSCLMNSRCCWRRKKRGLNWMNLATSLMNWSLPTNYCWSCFPMNWRRMSLGCYLKN